MATRPERRRDLKVVAGRKEKDLPLAIEADPAIVLKKPQHYHVHGFVYERLAADGTNFEWSTEFEVVASEIELGVSYAKRNAKRPLAHVKKFWQCADPAHLEGLD